MKAVIVYEDRELAGKVNAMLNRTVGRMVGSRAWTVRPWRVDLLTLPQAAEAALDEAADAHFMVLALGSPGEPPAGLLEWLEVWAGRRQVRDAALAVFDNGASYTQVVPAVPKLSEFAGRHGLSFILGSVGSTREKSEACARRHREREAAELAALTPSFVGGCYAFDQQLEMND